MPFAKRGQKVVGVLTKEVPEMPKDETCSERRAQFFKMRY